MWHYLVVARGPPGPGRSPGCGVAFRAHGSSERPLWSKAVLYLLPSRRQSGKFPKFQKDNIINSISNNSDLANVFGDAVAFGAARDNFLTKAKSEGLAVGGWAREAMKMIVTGKLEARDIVTDAYEALKPTTAKGALAEPKDNDKAFCGLSYSSIRGVDDENDVVRKRLDTLMQIVEHWSVTDAARSQTILFMLASRKAHSFSGLAKFVKAEKSAVVRAASEARKALAAIPVATVADKTPAIQVDAVADTLAEMVAYLASMDVSSLTDAANAELAAIARMVATIGDLALSIRLEMPIAA